MRFVVAMLLAAAALPFAWLLLSAVPSASTLARWGPGWDNRDVRASAERLGGWRRRAHLAQLNGHEAFAPFAAALIVAHLAGAPGTHALAFTFLVCRVLHGICYLMDRPTLRSTFWLGGALATLSLFVLALAR